MKESEDGFKRETLDLWKQVLGDHAYRYKFDEMLSTLYKAIRFKELPPETLTVHQHSIVNVYRAEYNLHRDKKDFEDRGRRNVKS